MSHLKRLVREFHRRSVWQVLGIFLAASWGVIEVVDLLTEQVGLPDWTPTMALVFLLIGLPVVLATAIVQEGMPGQNTDADEAPSPSLEPGMAPGTGSLDRPSTRPSPTRRLFTWRNAILGGLGAFTLLGVSLVIYFFMWTTGIGPAGNLVAQGVIEDGERLVLATFDDATDEGLGEVVTEALRVDLAQAQVLSLVEPVEVDPVLARMQLEPGTRLTGELAREVALREGIGAVLEGEVARAGSAYLLTASLIEGSSGRSLAAFRVTAEGPEDIIPAIDKLSQDIREKSGESLRRIRGGEELERVTTASLDALRLFTQAEQAVYRGDQRRALELLDEAVEVDPAFAMAWRRMAALLNNTGTDWVRHEEAATEAYRHRDRLSERERYLTQAYYYSAVEKSREQTVAAYQNVLRLEPDDASALNNLANEYLAIHDFERARELYRKAVDGPGRSPVAYSNLVRTHVASGDALRAIEVFEEYRVVYPDDVSAFGYGFHAHLLAGDLETAEALVSPLTDDPGLPIFVRVGSIQGMADLAYWRGRLDEGRRHSLAAERVAAEVGPAFELGAKIRTAELEVRLGDANWGMSHLRQALDGGLWDSVDPLARNWIGPTLMLLREDGLEEARGLFAQWQAALEDPEEDHRRLGVVLEGAAGTLDDPVGALDEIRTETGCDPSCWPAWTVEAAWAGGRAEERLAAAQPLVDRGMVNLGIVTLYRLSALLELGELHEEVGDTAAAREAYRRAVELWTGADARGQERVERLRGRLEALGG